MQVLQTIEELPPRENLIKMHVTCRPLNQPLPHGQSVSCGEEGATIVVMERHEQQIMDMLETEPEKIGEAEKHFEADLAEYMEKSVKDGDVANASEADWKRARAQCPGSIQASFHTMFKRDIKPLISAKVLERNIPPREATRVITENSVMIKELLTGLAPMLMEAAGKVGDKAAAAAVTKALEEATAPSKGKKADR